MPIFNTATLKVGAQAVLAAYCGGNSVLGPSDGYDIILLAGQSNMAGRGVYNAGIDTTDANVFQFDGKPASGTYRTIIGAVDPLKQAESTLTAVGPGMFFGKAYAAATGRKVLLVPAAWGGTALTGASAPWSPSGTDTNAAPAATGESVNYFNAIRQANLAITAAVAAYPGSQFVGTLWIQGEADGDSNVSKATYQAALLNLISGFRAGITGASNSWFVIGQMMPEAITVQGKTYPSIDQAHKEIAGITNRCGFAAIGAGYNSGDNLHYNAAGERLMGTTMAGRVNDAKLRTSAIAPGQVVSLTAGSPDASTVPLSWDYPLTGGVTTDFVVEYKLTSGGSWTTFTDGTSVTPSATVSGLDAATSYDFRVSASNGAGTGSPSATVTATTAAAATTAFVRLGTLTGMLESGSAGVGWSYGAASGATFAANHAGVSDKKLPAGVDGAITWTLDASAGGGTRNYMLGVVTSQSDPVYSAGASGYKYAVYNGGGTYTLKKDGSATSVTATVAVTPENGDVVRLRRTAGVWVAEVARSATPTAFTTIYTFPVSDNNDAWFAACETNSFGTGYYAGPLVGTNVV